MKKINFIISADSNYLLETEVLINTIKNFYPESLIFYFTDKLSKEFFINKKYNNIIFFTQLFTKNANERFEDSFGTRRNINSLYRFGRLLFPFAIKKEYYNSTFVYLDSDTFLDGKIDEKYIESNLNFAFRQDDPSGEASVISREWWVDKLKLKGYPDIAKKIEEIVLDSKYFNSGVLIINDIHSYIKLSNRCIKSKLKLNDQTLLNYFNEGSLNVVVDEKYNSLIDRVNDKAIIYHYAGNSNFLKVKNPVIKNVNFRKKLEEFIDKL